MDAPKTVSKSDRKRDSVTSVTTFCWIDQIGKNEPIIYNIYIIL